MKSSRNKKYKPSYKLFFFMSKIVLIWYLMLFTSMYLFKPTDAVFTESYKISNVIHAETEPEDKVIEESEPIEEKSDEPVEKEEKKKETKPKEEPETEGTEDEETETGTDTEKESDVDETVDEIVDEETEEAGVEEVLSGENEDDI